MKTCYLYIRTASKNSRDEDSIELQKKQCQSYARKHNFRILKTFYDIGVSGQTLNRKGLRDLIARCDIQSVDAILVPNIGGISRNVADMVKMYGIFSKNGIEIVSIHEDGIYSDSFTLKIHPSCIEHESEGRELK